MIPIYIYKYTYTYSKTVGVMIAQRRGQDRVLSTVECCTQWDNDGRSLGVDACLLDRHAHYTVQLRTGILLKP